VNNSVRGGGGGEESRPETTHRGGHERMRWWRRGTSIGACWRGASALGVVRGRGALAPAVAGGGAILDRGGVWDEAKRAEAGWLARAKTGRCVRVEA
jgi:hypothetical protein